MIKVVINGALGRMGGIVACEIDAADDLTLAGAVDATVTMKVSGASSVGSRRPAI